MAFSDILKQLNWLDFFAIILLLRISYVAIKNGIPLELFKLLGAVAATYFSLHYYSCLTAQLAGFGPLKSISTETLSFSSFIILALAAYFIFVLLRKLFFRFINIKAESGLDRWGGFTAGVLRGLLAVSLVIFATLISPFDYFHKSAKNAYFASRLLRPATGTYAFLWENALSKFMDKENFNEAPLKAQEGLNKQ